MRLPRKGILIRLLIYVPLIGFFGWRAYERYAEQRKADSEAAAADQELDHKRRTVTLPDGRTQEILVVTPEEAERLMNLKVPDEM